MLDRKTLSDSRAVGFVDPGSLASRGKTPSPDTSIAIGMLPVSIKQQRQNSYHSLVSLVVESLL